MQESVSELWCMTGIPRVIGTPLTGICPNSRIAVRLPLIELERAKSVVEVGRNVKALAISIRKHKVPKNLEMPSNGMRS